MPHSPTTYQGIIARAGFSLDEEQLGRLAQYATLLLEWNQRVNLVSRKDESNIWPAHILHSLTILMGMNVPDHAKVADLGSGGGLPGIPIAIALPTVEVVLIESIRKKCLALGDMIDRLNLNNTSVINARAEDLGAKGDHEHSFDLILARAVAPLADLVKWSLPLVRRDQRLNIRLCGKDREDESLALPALIALKGGSLEEEIRDVRNGGKLRYVKSSPIEFEGIEKTGLVDKSLVIICL